jgi:hypothetical protein
VAFEPVGCANLCPPRPWNRQFAGDGIAKGVALSGSVLSLGQRGGDYDENCGNESYPLQTPGRTVEASVHLSAEGGVLEPRLIADGGFLKQGSAWVQGPQGLVEAQALTLSGFTYGYAATRT